MARLPTVGASKLHLAQLSPQVRRVLARRAKKAAKREYAPVLKADRRAFGAANREYKAEKQSVLGATGQVENTLADALRGLKTSGLTGGALKQAQREFTSRQADTASSIPFLLGDAAKTKKAAIVDARTALIEDQAQKGKSTAEMLNQTLKEQRTAASSELKSKEGKEAEHDKNLASDARSIRNALIVANKGYTELLQNTGKETKDGVTIHPPKTDAEWRAFITQVAKEAEGADPVDAARAVQLLRDRLNRRLHEGKIKQPGVPASG